MNLLKILIGNKIWGLVFIVFLFSNKWSLGQVSVFMNNYTPIEIKGEIPEEYMKGILADAQIEIDVSDKALLNKDDEFITTTSFSIKEMFVSGNIYFNDTLSAYVQKVAKTVLLPNGLDQEIRVFVGRQPYPSANIWMDGTLIINVGLLALLENESQLAFVIAHEATHYVKKHPYEQYANSNELDAIQKRTLENLKSRINFSNQQELEADRKAIDMVRRAGYQPKEGVKVIDFLKAKRNTQVEFEEIPSLGLPVSTRFKCEENEYKYFKALYNEKIPYQKKTENLDIRYHNLTSQTMALGLGELNIFSQEEFDYIQAISGFEEVENAFRDANFYRSIYLSLKLLKSYPENSWLNCKLAENLFYIAQYSEMGNIDRLLVDFQKIEEEDYAALYCMFSKMQTEDIWFTAYGYIQKQFEKFGDKNETIGFLYPRLREISYGMEDAKSYYNTYLENFPGGKYNVYVKRKLNE